MRTALQALTTFLLNAAWQAALVAAVAFAGDWLLRSTNPRYRHVLWVSALLLSIGLPGLSSLSPRATQETDSSPRAATNSTRVLIVDDQVPAEPVTPVAPGSRAPAIQSAPSESSSSIPINRPAAAALVTIYLGLLLYGCARLLRAWFRTRRLLANAYPVELPQRLRAIVASCSHGPGRRTVKFYLSRSISLPITVGSLRPLIILPESLLDETDENVLTSGIGHEMVHVARWDYLTNLIYELICIPLWFHPAVALIMRRIRQTRELCCDEAVASKFMQPDVYARSLVQLISATSPQNHLAATIIGFTGPDNLEKRIMSLLRPKKITATRLALGLIGAGVLLIAPCVVGAKLALAFEIAAAAPAPKGESFEKTPFGQEQLRVQEEMKNLEHALQEQVRTSPEPQRAEIEKRLLEVQLNLISHQQNINRYKQQKPSDDEMRRLRELLAQVETKYPRDQKLINEARAKMAEAEKLYAELAAQSGPNRNPRLISGAQPAYTDDARAKGITGGVLVTVTVGRDGTVQAAALKRGLFPSLDESAVQAARKLRFESALENGVPVSATITVEFFFSAQSSTGNVDQAGEVGNWVNADRQLRRLQERDALDDRARRHAEWANAAVISMDRAIQIAISKYSGKVLACTLGRDKDGPVFYHLIMVITEGDKTVTKYVWISAVDGTILKTEDVSPRETVWRGTIISGGVLNGKASSLPPPEYPPIARAARASGIVTVEIVTDEQGNVVSAKAVSGHPLLQDAAVNAARKAKFSPTYLQGKPVNVRGTLTYNFIAQ